MTPRPLLLLALPLPLTSSSAQSVWPGAAANTIGLPKYMKQAPDEKFNKFVELEAHAQVRFVADTSTRPDAEVETGLRITRQRRRVCDSCLDARCIDADVEEGFGACIVPAGDRNGEQNRFRGQSHHGRQNLRNVPTRA